MTIKQRPETLAPQRRTFSMRLQRSAEPSEGGINTEARTLDLAFASETPVDMWYGTEILSLAPGAMRTGVRQETMPLLFNHKVDDLLGIVQALWVGADRIARATVRFGKDERGEWAMNQAADDVLVNVSFVYRVFKFVEDTEAETLTAIDWEAYEISLVTVPADAVVGVGRSADTASENGVQITRSAAATTPAPQVPGVSTAPGAHSLPTTPQEQEMNVRFRTHRLQNAVEETTGGGGAGTGVTATVVTNGHTPEQTRAHEQRGAEGERARIADIEAIAKKYDLAAEVRTGLIQRGATADQARITAADIVMERARSSASSTVDFGDTVNPDLSAKEKARYSMIRAVNASINGNKWDKAGFELECSNEISKRLGRSAQDERAFFMPTNIPFAQRATYTVGTPGAGTSGGTLVATNLLAGSFIEVLQNVARTMQAGATVITGLVGIVDIPRQTGKNSAYWTAEGVDTTQSEATFDKVSLAMKTIGTVSQITRNMLMQSTPDIDMIARAALITAIALGIDSAALSGTGTGAQPLGIANQSGIGSVVGGANGLAITIDQLIDLETAVTFANGPEQTLAYMSNAKLIGSAKKLKSTTGQYLWTNSPMGQRSGTPGEINGYPMLRTNQARSTLTKGSSSGICSEVFFGAWSELLIGEWGVLEIFPNPYIGAVALNGGVQLRVLQSIDIAVRHAASFAVMSDALTP